MVKYFIGTFVNHIEVAQMACMLVVHSGLFSEQVYVLVSKDLGHNLWVYGL